MARTVDADAANARRRRVPTPIYETLVMGLLAYVLWQLRDRVRPGVLFALYLVFAGAERFLIEFIRRNDDVAFGLTAAQLESLSLVIVGAVWLFLVGRRGGLLRDDVPGRRQAAVPATNGSSSRRRGLLPFGSHDFCLSSSRSNTASSASA